MKKFDKFIIKSSPFRIDIISSLMWELNINGIEETENSLIVYSEKDSVSKKQIVDLLSKLSNENLLDIFTIEKSKVENKNWNEEWEKSLKIIKISDKIVIKPTKKDYTPTNNQIVLTIDPKMSFGTGRHQTTKLMLFLLEKYFNNHKKVLDVGSGTAILSIAAAKLGAEKVVAIDNDEWCFINGKENIEKNNVSDIVKVKNLEIENLAQDNFDLVLSNINKNVLISIKDELIKKIKLNGLLILSGILNSDEKSIVRIFTEQYLRVLEIKKLDDWSAIVYHKID